jgi:hypothetical protein
LLNKSQVFEETENWFGHNATVGRVCQCGKLPRSEPRFNQRDAATNFDVEANYLKSVATAAMDVFKFDPMAVSPAIITTAINMAIKVYSMAVAPSSFAANSLKVSHMKNASQEHSLCAQNGSADSLIGHCNKRLYSPFLIYSVVEMSAL